MMMNSKRWLRWIIGCACVALVLSGCVVPQASTVPTDVAGPEEASQDQFSDPFAYCAAVGTLDEPDARYTGPDVPEAIVQGLREALDTPDDAPMDWFVAGTVWRCMDGQVWACFVGANLPCTAKADISRTPTSGMVDFCQENPASDFIPAAATGRETVYEWRCADGEPEIVKELVEPDAQGFLSNIWYEISP
jgi:hypothetical protein